MKENLGFLEIRGGFFLGEEFCGVFAGDARAVSRPSTSAVALNSPRSTGPFVKQDVCSECDITQSGFASTLLSWLFWMDSFFSGDDGLKFGGMQGIP